MYRPEPRIIRYMREYDPDLSARWDREIERWRLTWRGKDISVWQNDDGSYRPLDERAVTWARLADAWQHHSGKEFLRVMEEENHRITAAQKAKMTDDFQQMMKEDGYRAVFGGPMINGWRAGA